MVWNGMDDPARPARVATGRSPSSFSVASALPWNTVSEPQRPSAYAHYKKLARDFDTLEGDLEQSRLAQEALEAQLRRHKDAVETHANAQRDQELAAWARERERRVEAICVHGAAVAHLRKQQAVLEADEIRLQAELDVLHERQQHANETEAKRVFDLVHGRTSLLEKELTKGQMDVEYLTHVISSAKRNKQEVPGDGKEGDAIHAIVGDIKQRRQDALREATVQLQQRLHSFELEKEALKRKAEEIQWKKQRALQILSTNQQQVITGFFTTPRAAIQDANPPLPSLEFNAILDTLRQPTGDGVSRLQDLEHGKASGRKQLRDALAEAARNVLNGPTKLEAIERQMKERQEDALRLNITPSSIRANDTMYDGAWSVETYRHEQFPVVYFVRSMVFGWMERALEISRQQPETQLLKLEIQRHVTTHAVLETLETRARLARCAVEICGEIEHDVARDMAESILEELRFSADHVRDVIQKQLQAALFYPTNRTMPMNPNNRVGKPSVQPQQPPAVTLRWAMFGSAWEEIKRQQNEDASSTRRLPRLLMRPADTKSAKTQAEQRVSVSPTKKRFGGLFGGVAKPPPAVETKAVALIKASERPPPTTVEASDETTSPSDHPNRAAVTVLTTEVPMAADADSPLEHREVKAAERNLWERYVCVSESSFPSLPSCAFVSCVQLSQDGQLLAIGTLDGEVIIFTNVGEDDETGSTPTAVRVSAADKAVSASSVMGVARIIRLCFSSCARLVLSYNQLKLATLWTLTPLATTAHSPECFATDSQKAKPPALSMVSVLAPLELFQEPPVPPNVLEQDAPVAAARLQAAPPTTIAACQFFPYVALTGEPTHLICGASNGDLLKVAMSALTKQDCPKWVLGPASEAAFELSRPVDTVIVPKAHAQRELFRSAHRHSVLFVSAVAPLASTVPSLSPTRLISVDQRGDVALWVYSQSSFSGFGWFVPLAVYPLDLAHPTGPSANGEILQIQLTPDRKTLVLMVFLAARATANTKTTTDPTAGRLRFVQLDLSTNELRVKPVRTELSMAGTIAPRFALIHFKQPSKATPRPRSGATRALPGLSSPSGASFLVLLMDNALHVISLRTGDPCRPAIPLHASPSKTTNDSRAKATRKEPPARLFNSISAASSRPRRGRVGTTGAHVVAKVAVAGETHRHVRLVRFSIPDS